MNKMLFAAYFNYDAKMLPDQNAEFDERWLSLSVFCLKTTSSLPPVWPDAQCSRNWTLCYLPSLTIQTSSPSFTKDAEYSLYISTVIAVWLQMPNVAWIKLGIFIWFPKEAPSCEWNCTVIILFIVCLNKTAWSSRVWWKNGECCLERTAVPSLFDYRYWT